MQINNYYKMENFNQKLLGLSKKIDQLLSDHNLENLCICLLIVRPIDNVHTETYYKMRDCDIIRDPETGELILKCKNN